MMVTLPNINELAGHLRAELAEKKFILLYAYNGTGKTPAVDGIKGYGQARRRRGRHA